MSYIFRIKHKYTYMIRNVDVIDCYENDIGYDGNNRDKIFQAIIPGRVNCD